MLGGRPLNGIVKGRLAGLLQRVPVDIPPIAIWRGRPEKPELLEWYDRHGDRSEIHLGTPIQLDSESGI